MSDLFDKIASEFLSERERTFQTQPLRTRYDYGERLASTPSFEEVDTDGDGYISPDEWEEAFDMVTDSEDFINDEDFDGAPRMFNDMDSDDDGVVSRGDWEDAFDDFDPDDDGFISESSFYGRRANLDDLDDLDDMIEDVREDLEDVDDFIDDLESESEEADRFVSDFESTSQLENAERTSSGYYLMHSRRRASDSSNRVARLVSLFEARKASEFDKAARFHEGPKGRKEFEEWMDDQGEEFQEKWDDMKEEYGDKFKKSAFMEDDFIDDWDC